MCWTLPLVHRLVWKQSELRDSDQPLVRRQGKARRIDMSTS